MNDTPVIHDGALDALITNLTSQNVSVLLGDGAGSFAASPGSPIGTPGSAPHAVALADVNGDGCLDALIVNAHFNSLGVLLGNGAGSFAPAAGSPATLGGAPLAVALGDVNGDGRLDALVTNGNSDTVSVLVGDGAGGFAPAAGSPVAVGDNPVSIALGDVNGDDRLDAIVVNANTNNVSILLGNGAGGFAPAGSPVGVGVTPVSVALGDVNGDGHLDAFVANADSNNVTLLLGDGAGGFAVAAGSPTVGSRPFSIALGDVNGDGRLDALVVNVNDNDVSVLLGDGAGGFAPAAGSPVAVGLIPDFVALGDLNGDGRLDALVANANSNDVSVLLGNGAGGFTPAAGSPVMVGTEPHSIALGNIDNLEVVAEDTNLAVSSISITDVDANGGAETLTLSAPHGTLTLGSTSGLTFTAGHGNGTGSVIATGTLADLNAALATLTYRGVQDFNGSDTLTVSVNDNGHTGAGAARTATRLIPFSVTPVNDPPTIVSDGGGDTATVAILENTTAVTTVTGTDPDSSPLTYSIIGGTDAGKFQINASSGALSFVAAPDFEAPADADTNNSYIVTVRASDGALTGEQTLTVNISNVSEPPVNSVPGTQEIEANTNAAITGLSIMADAGAVTLTTTLSVAHGILTVASAGGAAVSESGSDSITLTGTPAQINTTLAASLNVVYRGAPDYFGSDTLTMTTTDGPLSDADTVTLHLNTLLSGTPGDDQFTPLPGNARIDGLGGNDTITFGFRLVDAKVSFVGNTVVIDGPSGSHTVLTSFENYVFADGTAHENDGDRLVDDLYYYSQYHDVWNAHVDADQHYHQNGWHEGRNPNGFFNTAVYLTANPDVKAANVDPLIHFDEVGWKEGRIPSIVFDPRQYLSANLDVNVAGVDPLAHFLQFGASEGRHPFASTELIAANGFDYVYYLAHNPDVAAALVDPFQHYETIGWKEGRNPNALFDVNGYLANYADVATAHINPLDHYNQFGWHEGRDPSPGFDTTDYMAAYADVNAAHINPLAHFLQFGIHEGRSTFADGVWG